MSFLIILLIIQLAFMNYVGWKIADAIKELGEQL